MPINSLIRQVVAAVAVAALLGASALDSSAQGLPRVAVLDFENRSGWWTGYLGSGAADVLTTKLVQSGQFTVVDRLQLARILEEQQLQLSGAVDPATAGQIGKLLGVQYLIAGSVTSFQIEQKGGSLSRIIGRSVSASITEASATMNVRMINTETAAIVGAADAEGSHRLGAGFSTSGVSYNANSRWNPTLAGEALGPTAEDLVNQLVDMSSDLVVTEVAEPVSPPEIVGGTGESVYIDHGENRGMEVGQRFEVMRVVDEIVDGEGNILDVITERVGIIQVDQVLSQSSVCSVVEGEALEGDQLIPVSD